MFSANQLIKTQTDIEKVINKIDNGYYSSSDEISKDVQRINKGITDRFLANTDLYKKKFYTDITGNEASSIGFGLRADDNSDRIVSRYRNENKEYINDILESENFKNLTRFDKKKVFNRLDYMEIKEIELLNKYKDAERVNVEMKDDYYKLNAILNNKLNFDNNDKISYYKDRASNTYCTIAQREFAKKRLKELGVAYG